MCNWASGLTPTCAEAHDGTEPEGNQTILAQIQKAIATGDCPLFTPTQLGRPNVLSLPPLRSFCDLKLHLLAFLQALETACLDSREVHENVFATLAADKTVAFGVVKPLYCTLFHVTRVPFNRFYAGGESEVVLGRDWLISKSCSHQFGSSAHSSYPFRPQNAMLAIAQWLQRWTLAVLSPEASAQHHLVNHYIRWAR